MKSKTILTAALSAAMILSLTACGKSAGTAADAAPNQTPVADTETEAPIETPDTETEAPAEEQTAEILLLKEGETLNVNGLDLSIHEDFPEGEDAWEGASVMTYGDTDVQVEEYSTGVTDSYVIVDSDSSFRVIMTSCHENDWRISHLYQYDSASGFTLCDTTDGSIDSIDDLTATTANIHFKLDCFGSYSGIAKYDISANTFELSDTYYEIVNEPECDDGSFYDGDGSDITRSIYDSNGRRILTVKAAFQALDESETAQTIPVGAIIYPVGADLEKGIFYFTLDDATYHVNIEKLQDQYGFSVDGVSEFDLFETVPYAG